MSDPYKILGVSVNATNDQIKTAYRELARKYHPDNYVNNPLSDLASEKMKEINEAYDAIVTSRKNGAAPSQTASYASGNSQFADIRRLINSGRSIEAEELLDGIATANRDAEWYFLKGSVCYSKGWLDEALNHFSAACRMNPNNAEYKAAYNQMLWQRQTGQPNYGGDFRTTTTRPGCSCCDICATLYCADCICNICGGNCC